MATRGKYARRTTRFGGVAYTEAHIMACTLARLLRFGLVPDANSAVKALGLTVDDMAAAFRDVPVARPAYPSRLQLVPNMDDPLPDDTPDGGRVAVKTSSDGDHHTVDCAAFPHLRSTSTQLQHALRSFAAKAVKDLAATTARAAELQDEVERLHAAAPPPAAPQQATAAETVAPLPQRRRGKTTRPFKVIGGVKWLRCTCNTGCGPRGNGWWPEEAFRLRSDRKNGARRSLSTECYGRYQRSKRVTVAALAGMQAVGFAFVYDRAGSPTAISCAHCGEVLRSGDHVLSAGPVPLVHAGCARARLGEGEDIA